MIAGGRLTRRGSEAILYASVVPLFNIRGDQGTRWLLPDMVSGDISTNVGRSGCAHLHCLRNRNLPFANLILRGPKVTLSSCAPSPLRLGLGNYKAIGVNLRLAPLGRVGVVDEGVDVHRLIGGGDLFSWQEGTGLRGC